MTKKPDYLEAKKESNRHAQDIINRKACKHCPQSMILAHFQRGKSLTVLSACSITILLNFGKWSAG